MESVYNAGDNASIRHIMPPSKSPSAKNELHLAELLAKYHRVLPRPLVALNNLMVGPSSENNTYF